MPTNDIRVCMDVLERLRKFRMSGKRYGPKGTRDYLRKAARRQGLEDLTRGLLWTAWTMLWINPEDGLRIAEHTQGLLREHVKSMKQRP